MPPSNNNTFRNSDYFFYVANIVLKGTVCVTTQPLAGLQTIRQRNVGQEFMDSITILKNRGLFKGIVPGSIREMGKAVYKGPILLNAQNMVTTLLKNNVSEDWSKNRAVVNFLAGMGAGFADALISQPLDRMATYLKASTIHNQSFISYLRNSDSVFDVYQKLAKGFWVYALKQSVMISSFFISHSWSKLHVKKLFPDNEVMQHLFNTIVPPIVPAVVGSPIDVIKVARQMPGSSHGSSWQAMRTLIRNHGRKALTAGLGCKISLTYVGYVVNSFMLTLFQHHQSRR